MSSADFDLINGGSIFTLRPRTDAARDWVSEFLPDDALMLGSAYVVEHRYIGDIVDGIVADGLTIQ